MCPTTSTPWRTVIVICRKCGKKLKGGFGPKRKDTLRAVLRQTLRDNGRRRDVKILETGCLGLCPKHGVTALNAGCPGRVHVIPSGMAADAALLSLLDGNASEPD
jgi:predicted metal-binding protein